MGSRNGDRILRTHVGLGLGIATLLTQVVSTQLFGVNIGDPVPYLMASVVGVALAACFFPARRVTRIDPVQALRV